MKLTRRDLLRLAGVIGISCFHGRVFAAPDTSYWPRANEWESRKPADASMDPDAVEAALAARAIRVTIVGEQGDHVLVQGDLAPTQRVITTAVHDGESVREERR